MLDSQGLLYPSKEQFDLPALFVEVCNLFGGRVEIVGDDAQHLAGIDGDLKLAHRHLQRVFAASCEPRPQMPDSVAENISVLWYSVHLHPFVRRVLLQPPPEPATHIR